ncbi:STAS domain-containing protein [Paraglaciecola sp. 2405UD69-4]|uniref:STAS domain-containing protein n=1 Tax=Paraglaciecola sp. 2405UD69-4 TaxID=3391836 RepID=UPI0039C8EA43
MSIEREFSEDKTQLTIFVNERFDFNQVQEFRAAYSEDSDTVSTILIDLHKTEYMDSSALGMLLNMQKTLGSQVSTFKIVNCRPQVLKILGIARFSKKFTIS